jgi:hypothetical protein
VIVALSLLLAMAGQATDSSGGGAARRVEGRVIRGTREAEQPLVGQWVVLHRVGHDRSGPLDSVRTGPNGRFSFHYRLSGDTAAIYFATTAFGGIVYPTSPFHAPVITGDDAMIVVFDTTSGPVPIKIGGRHLIVGAPKANGRRPVGEVYDLQNDSTVTVIAKDSVTPVWTTHIPPSAVDFQINSSGELAAGAVSHTGTDVALFAPLSPGIRQLAFTYELPPSAFPLRIPVERPSGVFEVLVQEPTARVQAPAFREVPPQSAEGRVFRRFLAQDVPANIVLSVDVPEVITTERNKVYVGVGVVVLLSMIGALIFAGRRSNAAGVALPVVAETRSQSLVRTLASLDEEFEKTSNASEAAREHYTRERSRLKAQLAGALDDERRRS